MQYLKPALYLASSLLMLVNTLMKRRAEIYYVKAPNGQILGIFRDYITASRFGVPIKLSTSAVTFQRHTVVVDIMGAVIAAYHDVETNERPSEIHWTGPRDDVIEIKVSSTGPLETALARAECIAYELRTTLELSSDELFAYGDVWGRRGYAVVSQSNHMAMSRDKAFAVSSLGFPDAKKTFESC